MNITIYSYLDQSLADSITTRAAEYAAAETAAVSTDSTTATTAVSTDSTEDFATVLRRIAEGQINASGESGAASVKLYSTEEMEPIFEEAAETYDISVDLLKAIGKTESAFNASAVSSAGAVGVMQLMPDTAAYLGVTDSYDAAQNIMGGAKLMRQLLDQYDGSVSLALAAYNAGSTNVDKYGGIPPFTETQNYVRKVLSYFAESVSASSADETASTASTLVSDERTQVNAALESYFTSKNISLETLETLNTLLKTAQAAAGNTTTAGISEEAASIVLTEDELS